MRNSRSAALLLTLLPLHLVFSCSDTGSGPSAPLAGQAGLSVMSGAPSAGSSSGGASHSGVGGTAGAPAGASGSGEAGRAPTAGGTPALPSSECGDSAAEGVRVAADVVEHTTWSCPVYTLTKPIFVLSQTAIRTKLTIASGTRIRALAGDLDAGLLPGALIVTRSAVIEAIGTETSPIVFTSARPVGSRGPGDWGGLVLLGRAATNVPANLDSSGNRAGEMFVEGLPRSDLVLYGAPLTTPDSGAGGSAQGGTGGGAGAMAGIGGSGSAEPAPLTEAEAEADATWSCGTLRYVRIEFPGFEVAAGRELNGLTLGGCGRDTRIDHIQVHKSSDDGIELFGGSVDLSHVVVTGAKDDALDWDQGYRGRLQFVALQMHDDSTVPAEGKGDNGIEADGYADPASPTGPPSSAEIRNMTLLASATSQRGVRAREGTQLLVVNAIIGAAPGGAAQGLLDLGDALTADWIAAGQLRIENTILSGPWPASGQSDSRGIQYIEADFFTTGAGSLGNHEIATLTAILPQAFDEQAPGWVPAAGTLPAMNAALHGADPTGSEFYREAPYRGAFAPGGEDWTGGWTAYPLR